MAQSVFHPYGDPIPRFKLKQGTELLTDHAGLALVGLALAKFARVCETLDKAIPKRSGLSVGEIVTAYVGLLCTGKSDFDAIENHRQDSFFAEALGLSAVPAASTLRMQLDAQADGLLPLADELSVALLKNAGAPSRRWPAVWCRWTSTCLPRTTAEPARKASRAPMPVLTATRRLRFISARKAGA